MREVARVRVTYGDTDQMGIVYYANYLRWFEVARNEFLRAAGQSYRVFEEREGLFLPVVEAHVGYHKPARYDDVLAIDADLPVDRIKGASARFEYVIRKQGTGPAASEKLATGYTVHACTTRDGRPTRIPPELREALRAAGQQP
jgi:acyl-CoA thioester hydrolase